jgi:hypothetical protein
MALEPLYRDVLGLGSPPHGRGGVYRFGDRQLNGPSLEVTEVADRSVQPGGSDLCFRWSGSPNTAVDHPSRHDIILVAGPVERHGAAGMNEKRLLPRSRGSLIEFGHASASSTVSLRKHFRLTFRNLA